MAQTRGYLQDVGLTDEHLSEDRQDDPATPAPTRPLEVLVFLLPPITFYEVACLLLSGAATPLNEQRVVAFHLLQFFFQLFGSTGVWMPGLAVIIILLCTQMASGQPWRVRLDVVVNLYAQSVLFAVPLLAAGYVVHALPVAVAGGDGAWLTNLVLGIGAGVYEELIFRLILISLIMLVGVDLLQMPVHVTVAASIIISALAFSAHHHPPLGGEPFALPVFAFRALAGGYLGVLFVWRGYGAAAGAHVAYNIIITMSP